MKIIKNVGFTFISCPVNHYNSLQFFSVVGLDRCDHTVSSVDAQNANRTETNNMNFENSLLPSSKVYVTVSPRFRLLN